nr:DNA-binding protein [Nesterenkonia muleiensis]
MERKSDDAASADYAAAEKQHHAQQHLMSLGAQDLPAVPWRPDPLPPSAVELTHFALWRLAELGPEDIAQALTLLPAARSEVDGLEAGLIFAARSEGLTWAEIAEAMGFKSPQACQQHFTRLATRREKST